MDKETLKRFEEKQSKELEEEKIIEIQERTNFGEIKQKLAQSTDINILKYYLELTHEIYFISTTYYPNLAMRFALVKELSGKSPNDLLYLVKRWDKRRVRERIAGTYSRGFLKRENLEESEIGSSYNDRVCYRYYQGQMHSNYNPPNTWFKREEFDYNNYLFDLWVMDKTIGSPKKEILDSFLNSLLPKESKNSQNSYRGWPELKEKIIETFGDEWKIK
ncbi:hypothetical protein J4474_01050 [Candidatus Pacearchaeota archaeon]|nr:hypothetical protein [Candidatus Pacearchaeota archaeon]